MGLREMGFVPFNEAIGRDIVKIVNGNQYYWMLNRSAASRLTGKYVEVMANRKKRMIAIRSVRKKTENSLTLGKSSSSKGYYFGRISSEMLRTHIEEDFGKVSGKFKMKWNREGKYFTFEI
jgi:hypothetical protein